MKVQRGHRKDAVLGVDVLQFLLVIHFAEILESVGMLLHEVQHLFLAVASAANQVEMDVGHLLL